MFGHRLIIIPAVLTLTTYSHVSGQAANPRYENLQVLPATISDDSLGQIMLDNLSGLGLARLEGQGCLFCHVGDMNQPRGSWDFASDNKPMKDKARVMMAMVDAINQRHLPALENRIDEQIQVTCYTCHAGRTDPRPLPDILTQSLQAGGIDSLAATYTDLRSRYFGADAYDFRPNVLGDLALGLADDRDLIGAIAVARLNVEANPGEPTAKRGWLQLILERAFLERGIDTAIIELDNRLPELEPGVVTPGLLNALGWRLYRAGHRDAARALFDDNVRRFPNEYIPQESLAFVLWDAGEREAAYQVLEQWLSGHPDHERASRLLINLRARP